MLTGPTPSEHAGVVEIPNDLVVSITPLIGADSPSIRPLGNESHQVRITCIRRYPTMLDAMEARATFMRSLPRSGQLELFQYSLAATLTIVGEGAVRASSPTPVLQGRSLAFNFLFAVPLITAVQTLENNVLRGEGGTVLLNENSSPLVS